MAETHTTPAGRGGGASSNPDLSAAPDPAPAGLYASARIGSFTYTFPGLTPGQLYTLRLHFVETGYSAPGQRLFNVAINGSPALTSFDIFAAAGAKNRVNVQEFSVAANGSGQIVVAFTAGAADQPVCNGLEVLPFVHTVANNYDADDRLVSTIRGTGNGNGDIVSYTYDGPSGRGSQDVNGQTQYGLLSSKTDGNGHTTTYTYTARNEPYQTFYADGTSEGVAYDNNGNLTVRAKGDGRVINYVYDADNRLTNINYPTSPTPATPSVAFLYDADGRRTQMTDGSGTTTWTYGDGLHLTHINSSRGDVYYSYYPGGERKTMTAPGVNPSNSMACYTYVYDFGDRLTSLQNPFGETTSFAYNDDGTVQKKTLASGASISYWYDPFSGQTTDLQFGYPALNSSYSHHYTYTPAGSLASRSESDGGVNTFVYDGMDQLVSEVRTGGVPFSHGYSYDHNGNRLTETVNGSLVQQFSYDAHDKLTGGIGESESYDANGNLKTQMVNGQTTTYTWDDEDRLVSQQFADGHTDGYGYTGLGMRLTKGDPTGSYSYLTDGVSPSSPVLSDGRSSFTPGISEYNALGSRFYVTDAQGNSRGLLDGGQAAQDGYNWDGFGNLVSRFGSNPTAFAWNEEAGYQSDGDSGLKLLGHRYYDSRTGRFISQDPAGNGGNWYAYCGNDPMNGTDPSGLVPQWPGQPDETSQIPGFTGTPTYYLTGVYPWFVDSSGMGYDLDSYGYTGPDGPGESASAAGGGSQSDSDPGLFDGVGGAFGVGFSAVGSAASFHLWDGGAAQHDPSFGVSRGLADVGVAAATAAFGGEAAEGAEATTGCFTAGTPVQTDNGPKPIETIRAGDLVSTRGPQTGKTESRKVVRTFIHPAHETVTAQLADELTGQVVETLTATPEHPFYVLGRGFMPLGSLTVGTQVVTRAGPALVVASMVRHSDIGGVLVYNLEVEGDHTYFVGNANGGIWVHNDCDTELYYLVDHNVPQFGTVAQRLGEMGYKSESVLRRFGRVDIADPSITRQLTEAYGDAWRVITKDVTKGGFSVDKIIHITGGNSTRTAQQVLDILVNHHGF